MVGDLAPILIVEDSRLSAGLLRRLLTKLPAAQGHLLGRPMHAADAAVVLGACRTGGDPVAATSDDEGA